jgi:kumamolisin
VIELGGGYRVADLQKYFSDINSPLPKVSSVSVDHARNHATGDPNGPDGEVMLDIEVAGTIAPEADIVGLSWGRTWAALVITLTGRSARC